MKKDKTFILKTFSVQIEVTTEIVALIGVYTIYSVLLLANAVMHFLKISKEDKST